MVTWKDRFLIWYGSKCQYFHLCPYYQKKSEVCNKIGGYYYGNGVAGCCRRMAEITKDKELFKDYVRICRRCNIDFRTPCKYAQFCRACIKPRKFGVKNDK